MTRKWLFLLLVMVCLTQSGCELLSIPGVILGGIFGLASSAIGTAGQAASAYSSMGLPPPWIFF